MTSETLAPDIAWEPSGHLSEVALSALADGEEALLDTAMLGHVDACEACAVELGEIAMRGAHVGDALSLLGAAAASVPASVDAPVGVDAWASVDAPVSAGARGAAPVVVPAPAPMDSEARGRSIFVASAPKLGSATQASWAISRSATDNSGRAAEKGPPPARRKVPVAVIGAALAVAVIGAAPGLASLPHDVAETASVLQKVLPSLVRMLPVALGKLWNGPTTGAAAALMWSLSLALIAAGFGIAKKASKRTLVNGGRR